MKTIIIFISLMLFSVTAVAGQYAKKGKVIDVLVRTDSEHYAILYVDGFTQAGSCRTFSDHVIISLPDDEKSNIRYSMLLAAHMADKNVHVTLNDAKKTSDGSCIVQDLRLNKEF